MVTPLISDIIIHNNQYYLFVYGDNSNDNTFISLITTDSLHEKYNIHKKHLLQYFKFIIAMFFFIRRNLNWRIYGYFHLIDSIVDSYRILQRFCGISFLQRGVGNHGCNIADRKKLRPV